MFDNVIANMPADLEQTNLPQSPRVTNQPQPGTPPLRYRLRFHKLLNSVYFRIGLTVFLTLLLFLTAAFISFRAEQKKHQLEQYEKEIPGAKILIPTEEPDPTSDWKIFRDDRFLFEFKYPPNWSSNVLLSGSKVGPLEIKNEKEELIISVNSFDPSVVGISYCEATPEDERCESLATENGMVITIDWDINGKANAIFDGTIVTLEKVTRDTKQVFRQILSTLRFHSGL